MMHIEAIPGKNLETEITLIGQGTLLKGTVIFDRMTRVHGRIEGEVQCLKGSLLIIGESGSVHGKINGDEIIIDGFVHGEVRAASKLSISESGKLLGNAYSPNFEVKFGAQFEGKAITNHARDTSAPSDARRERSPSTA